jgi:FKBP-type peptidyl-prolyl cis-trans isomerase 2
MKVYKFEVMVLDFEDMGEEEIKHLLENNRFLHAHAMSAKSKEIEWDDDHPLNKCGTMARAYADLFAKDT